MLLRLLFVYSWISRKKPGCGNEAPGLWRQTHVLCAPLLLLSSLICNFQLLLSPLLVFKNDLYPIPNKKHHVKEYVLSLRKYILLFVCLLKHIRIVASNPLGVMISAHPVQHMFIKTHTKKTLPIKRGNLNAGQIKEGRQEYHYALIHAERAE